MFTHSFVTNTTRLLCGLLYALTFVLVADTSFASHLSPVENAAPAKQMGGGKKGMADHEKSDVESLAGRKNEPVVPSTSAKSADKERPFFPSYITVKDHRKLTPKDWTDPKICGQCHPRQYRGWNGSMHSNAFKDPIFQALWAMGEKATGGKFRNHCGGCHSPTGTVSGTIKFDPGKGEHGTFSADPISEQGISCDVCHTISGSNIQKTRVLEHGNTSIVLDPGNIKRGSLNDAKSPFHKTQYSEHHTSARFCGNCHNIFHPYNNFPVERTYDEWKYSIYAQNNIQCMDCHMVPVETAIRVADELKTPQNLSKTTISGFAGVMGPYRKVVHDHAFVGGNAVVTAALNGKKNYNHDQAVKRLKNVASLKLHIIHKKGPLYKLKVKVTNERAGHNLPTSLTEVRQIWLEVVAKDDQGRELMRSGTLEPDLSLPEDTVVFNAHAVDKQGKHTHFPWAISRFTQVNTIPPKGYKYGRYAFNVPDDARSVTVTAKLHYRSFSQKLADVLLGKGKIKIPSVEMKSITKTYNVKDKKLVITSNEH